MDITLQNNYWFFSLYNFKTPLWLCLWKPKANENPNNTSTSNVNMRKNFWCYYRAMIRISVPWKEKCLFAFFLVDLKVKVMIILSENVNATIKNGSKIKQIHLLTNEEAFKKYLVYTFKDWYSSNNCIYGISRESSVNYWKWEYSADSSQDK